MKSCRSPRCPKQAVEGTGYCTQHQRPPRKWGRDKRPPSAQRGYGSEWGKTRLRVIWRDKVCAFCGGGVLGPNNQPIKGTTVHHVIPRDDGGSDEPDNLVACHKVCHERHHGRRA